MELSAHAEEITERMDVAKMIILSKGNQLGTEGSVKAQDMAEHEITRSKQTTYPWMRLSFLEELLFVFETEEQDDAPELLAPAGFDQCAVEAGANAVCRSQRMEMRQGHRINPA